MGWAKGSQGSAEATLAVVWEEETAASRVGSAEEAALARF